MAITKDLLDSVTGGSLNPATGLQGQAKTPANKAVISAAELEVILKNPVSDPSVGTGSLDLDYTKYRNYGGMPIDTDLDEYRATNQSVGEQLAFGTGRLLSTTATKFLTGLGYTATGIPAIITGDINTMLDNGFSTAMAALEEYLKEDIMPIHHKKKYLDGNILNQMGTFGFWMDDVVDGLAFMSSAMVGAKGLDKIGSGIKAYTKLAKAASRGLRAAKTGRMVEGAAPALSKIAKFMDFTTINLYNSITEGAFEAKEMKDSILMELSSKVKSGEMTQDEANAHASNAAKNTLWLNVAALMPSNAVTNASIFKKFRLPGMGYTGAVGATVKPLTKMQQAGIFGKSALLNAASEGLYEENIQAAIQSYESDKVKALNDPELSTEFIDIFRNMYGNLFTDEGQKAIVLGAIIGMLPGGIGGVTSARAENKRVRAMQAASASYLEQFKKQKPAQIYKTKPSVLDPNTEVLDLKDGKPQIDPKKVQATAMGFYQSFTNLAASLKALNSGNEFMFEYIKNKNLGTVVAGMYNLDGRMKNFEEWVDFQVEQEKESLKEAGFEGDTEFFADLKQTYLKRARGYFEALADIDNNFAGLVSLPNTKEGNIFRTLLKSEQYAEAIDQILFEEQLEKLKNEELSLEEDTVTVAEDGTEVRTPNQVRKTIKELEAVLAASRTKMKDLLDYKKQEARFKQESAEIQETLDTKGVTEEDVSDPHTDPTTEDIRNSGVVESTAVGNKNISTAKHGILSTANEYVPTDKIFDQATAEANGYVVDENKSTARAKSGETGIDGTESRKQEELEEGFTKDALTWINDPLTPEGRRTAGTKGFNFNYRAPEVTFSWFDGSEATTLKLNVEETAEWNKLRKIRREGTPAERSKAERTLLRKVINRHLAEVGIKPDSELASSEDVKPTVFYKADKENKLLHTVVTDAEGNIIRDTLTKQITLFDAVTEDKKEVGINFVNGKLENIRIKDVKSGKVTTSKPSSDIASHGPNNISDILALLTLERGLVRNTELEDLGDLKARISRQVNANSLQYAPNIAREVTKLTSQLKQELENVPANEQAQYREDFVRRYYGDESKASSTISQIFEDGAITYVPAIYLGKVGIMENVDGEVVFKAITPEGKKESTEYLISNITNPESIDSLGITVLKQMPFEFQILHDGRTYNIQDVYYTNNFENPTDAVAYDNDGFPVSVTLWDYNNNKIEFTNPFIVEHISYAIELQQTVEEETVEGALRGENDFIMFEYDNSLYAAYRLPNGSLRFVATETNRPISGRLHAKVREEYAKQLHEAAEALSAAKLKIINSTKKHVKNAIRQHVPAIRSALTGEALKLPDTREVQNSKRIQEKPERSKKAKQETNDIIDKVASEAAKAEIARKQQAELDKQAEKEAAANSVQDIDDIIETSNESAETKIPDSGIRHSATAVAYVHLDPTTGTTKANNLNFAQDVINSSVESFQFSAEIDMEYAKFWDTHPELREEFKKGRLSSERIEELLAAEGTVFDKLVDTIPVKYIAASENKTYDNGIYMHESGYDNINPPSELYNITDYDKFVEEYIKYKNKIKEQTRQLRRKVISDLLSGKPVTFSGSNKTMGHPNNVGTNSNILTVLQKVKPGIDARSVNLLVAKRPGVVTEANNKISDVPLVAAPGNVFLETDATANGEFGYIKLNPSKLSIEHARIVLKAFRQAYSKGKGGFKAKYEGKDVTGGLTVLEVLNNLVYYSEDNTKINPKDKRKAHLLPKQLYVDSRYILHFGNNTMPLFTNEEAEIKRFLDWAHSTKNYAVNASMLGRNFKGKNKFSIGSATYDSSVDNYTSFILKNGFLLTDVDRVENTNSLYKDPVVGVDTESGGISLGNVTAPSTTTAQKPTTENITLAEQLENAVNERTYKSQHVRGTITRVQTIDGLKIKDGKIVKSSDPYQTSDETVYRNTTHMSVAAMEESAGGDWGHVTIGMVFEHSDVVKENGDSIEADPTDTYFYTSGDFVIPKSTKIVTTDIAAKEMFEGQGYEVEYISDGEVTSLFAALNKTSPDTRLTNTQIGEINKALGRTVATQFDTSSKNHAASILSTFERMLSDNEGLQNYKSYVISLVAKIIRESPTPIKSFDDLFKAGRQYWDRGTEKYRTEAELFLYSKEVFLNEYKKALMFKSTQDSLAKVNTGETLKEVKSFLDKNLNLQTVSDKPITPASSPVQPAEVVPESKNLTKENPNVDTSTYNKKVVELHTTKGLHTLPIGTKVYIPIKENGVQTDYPIGEVVHSSKSGVAGFRLKPDFKGHMALVELGRKLSTLKSFAFQDIAALNAFNDALGNTNMSKYVYFDSPAASVAPTAEESQATTETELNVPDNTEAVKAEEIRKAKEEADKKTVEESSPAESIEEQVSNTTGRRGLTPEQKAKMQQDEQKSAAKKNLPNPLNRKGPKGLNDIFNPFNRLVDNTPREYTPADVKAEIKALNKRLRANKFGTPIPTKIVDGLIHVARDRKAFAQFRADGFLLSNLAESGSLLHEAFHRVSLLYLTPDQRNTIYSEAKSLYGLKEDATNLEIEETLAEKYREYALIRQESPEVAAKMSIGKRIAKFFKDLYDSLYTWFTGTTRLDSYDVATLFKAIDNGKFKFARTRKDNLKELGGTAYNFEVKGVNVDSIQTTAEYREVVQNLFYLLAESNRLIETDYATGETSIRISSFQDVKNIKFGPLYATVRRLSLEHSEVVEASDVAIEYLKENTDISTEELNQIQREYLGEKHVGKSRLSTISQLNSQADVADRISTIFGEVYDKFDTFKSAVEDYMHSMNITAIRDESDIDLTEVDEDTGSNMSDYDRYNKTSYMVSAKENTALSIKLLISMLPAESGRSELTGMFKFVEFSPMWSRLMNTLIGMRNVEDMMSKLERASVDSVPYQILVRKLNNDEVLKTQFYRTMQKYKHNFINFLVSEDGIRISTAAVQQASTRYVKDWGTAFTKNTNFFTLDPNNKNKLKGNLELFQDKIDVFENLLISVSNDINKTGEVVDLESKINTLVELLNDVNIPIDSTSIRYGLARMNEINDSVGFRSLLLKNIPHIFSTKSTLYKVLNGEQLIGSNKKPTSIENIFVYEKGISYLASIFSESRIQELGDSIYGPQGNRYYTIAQNTYISDLLREIKSDLYGFLDKVSQSAYAQNSIFLQQLLENPELANKLDLLTISSFQREDVFDMGREYQALTPMEDTLMRMSAIESGKLVPPTPADRRFYYLYDGFTPLDVSVDSQGNLSDNVLDVFVGYAKDEIARIRRVRKDVDDVLAGKKSSEDLFETYHYRRYIGKGDTRITDVSKGIVDGKVLKEDGKYTGRGATFTDFVGLNLEMTDQELRTAVNEFLKDRIRDTEEMLTKLNIVNTSVESGTKQYYTSSLLENWIDKHQKITGDRNAAIADIIANFTVNTAFAAIETGKVFTGDPAAFKSSEDYVKRLPGATSTGDNLRTDFPAEYMPGERLIHSSTYNVSTFSSNVVESEFFEPLVKLHAEYYYEKGMVDSMEKAELIATEKLEGLLASDRTDAQTFISPEMYRAISIRLGKWTDAKENAYTILQSGEELSRLQAVELSDIVMEPLKMTYMDVMNRGGHAVPVFDKMSMSTLFRPMVQGTVLEGLLDRMEAKGEYQGLTPVDHIKFHTAEKVGIKDRRDFFKEGTEEETVSLKDIALYPQRFDRLRYQLVTDPHDVSTTMVGSQVKKIGISNIYPNDTYYLDGFTEESTVLGKDLRQHVNILLGELSNRGKNDLFSRYKINEEGTEFTDLEALTENLREEARKASLPDYVIENIKVGQDGTLYANFDSFPGNRAWIQSRLISVIKKAAIDLNMPGNAFIQMSDLGVKNTVKDASLSMLNDRGYTEAKVSVALFKNMIPGYAELTHEERVEYLRKTPEITSLGYRVPTQGQNSVYLMEIVDFLPDALGDTIILPKEGPALGGFDFDIDKMYVIRHHYRNGEKVRYLHEGNSTIEERAGAYAREAESEKISKIRKEASTKIKELSASLQDYRDGIKYAKEQIEGLGQYIELGIDLNESIEAIREQREIKEYNYKRLEEVKQEIKAIKEEVDNSISQIVEDWKEVNIESFSELSLPEQNTKQALENRLLDSYFSVLTNRNHLIRRTTPLGYTANMMRELAAKVREYKGIEEEVVSPLARVSPVYQLDVKSRYKFGGEGLGPFALANVHHILGQAAEISLFDYIGIGNSRTTNLPLPATEETAPARSEHTYTDLSQILGQDGIDITEWFSGLIDAHVDIAADPYVYYLNVNEYTRNVLALLLRSGVGGIKSMLFTSQPVLETIASKLENRGNVVGDTDLTPAATIREEYELSYAELSGKEAPKANTAEDVARIFNEDYLRGALQMPSGTAEYYRTQLEILDVFEFLQPYSEALKEATMASRVDTKKFGSSYSEVTNFKNRILKAYKDSNNGTGIRNFDRLMEETYINEYNQNSIEVISSVFSGVTLEGTPTFNRTVNDILELTGKQYSLDSSIIPNIVTEIYSEIYGEFFSSIGLNKKKASQLLSLDNGIATTVANIKGGTLFPELKNNAFIRALQPRIQEEGPQFVAFHKPDNVWHKEELSRAWKDIFSGNQQHVELAKDLFLYSFLTSGFRSTLHSFHDLVPIELVKYVGLDTFIKNKMREFNNHNIDNSALVNNVMKSLWNNSRIVPEIYKIDRASALTSSSKTAVIMPTSTQRIFSGYNRNGQRVYSPIIKYKNNMYEYLGYLESTDKPVYGIRDKKGYRKSGFAVKESSFPTTMFSENTSGVSKSVLDMLTPENFYQIINVSPKAKKNYTSYIGVTDLTLVTTAYEAQANASSTLLSKSNMFNPLSEDNMVVDQILQGETTVIGSTNSMQNFWTLPNGQIVFLELVEDVSISSELGAGYMYTVYDYGFKTPSFEEIEKRILEC